MIWEDVGAIIASGSNLIKMHYIGFPARIPWLYIPVEPITIFSGGGGGGGGHMYPWTGSHILA